jgi:hypothetical protein
MGRRKKVLQQLSPENLTDIQGEIEEEEKIIETNQKNKSKKPKKTGQDYTQLINKKSGSKDKEKKQILLAKIKAVEKVIELNPNLKKNKNELILSVISQNDCTDNEINVQKEYILHKITIDDVIYYRDMEFNIVDKELNLVGQYSVRENNIYEYNLFINE